MACCLPFGIAAAAGTAGLSVVLEPLRPYLMLISGVLLAAGLWQLYRRDGAACERRSRASIAIFWSCAALVLTMMLAPQVIANLLADLPTRQ